MILWSHHGRNLAYTKAFSRLDAPVLAMGAAFPPGFNMITVSLVLPFWFLHRGSQHCFKGFLAGIQKVDVPQDWKWVSTVYLKEILWQWQAERHCFYQVQLPPAAKMWWPGCQQVLSRNSGDSWAYSLFVKVCPNPLLPVSLDPASA